MDKSPDPFDRIILALAAIVFAGLAGMTLISGLVTGAIDGPARGRDLVAYAKNPQLFVFMSAVYACVFLGGVALAVQLLKHRNDP